MVIGPRTNYHISFLHMLSLPNKRDSLLLFRDSLCTTGTKVSFRVTLTGELMEDGEVAVTLEHCLITKRGSALVEDCVTLPQDSKIADLSYDERMAIIRDRLTD